MATEQGWLTRLGETGKVEWIPPPKRDRGQPRINPFHFIEAVIDYHQRRRADTAEPDDPAINTPWLLPEDWPDPDEPLPGDPEYDAALAEIARRFPEDHWPQAG